MDSACIINPNVKYVVTDDSAQVTSIPVYMKPAFLIPVVLFWLAGIISGILYGLGVFEILAEDATEVTETDALVLIAPDQSCLVFETLVDDCSEVSAAMIALALNGCETYYEDTGGVCGSSLESENSCMVNPDCPSTLDNVQFNPTDAMCASYTTVVNFCSDVSDEEIAENSCTIYYQSDGGVCISNGDSCKANYARCDIPTGV